MYFTRWAVYQLYYISCSGAIQLGTLGYMMKVGWPKTWHVTKLINSCPGKVHASFKEKTSKKMNKTLILALHWTLNGLLDVFGLRGWDVILLLVKVSWTDWFVLLLLMMYLINQTVPITINTTSPVGWNCEVNRRCGDLWWWSVAPARGFRHGKVDVAVTSMPEMTRIGTLTLGLISFSTRNIEGSRNMM